MPVVIFEHCREGKAAGVGGVIVCAAVVDGPVHELEIRVRAVGIEVKKIGQTHFAETNFEAAQWQTAEKGKRRA